MPATKRFYSDQFSELVRDLRHIVKIQIAQWTFKYTEKWLWVKDETLFQHHAYLIKWICTQSNSNIYSLWISEELHKMYFLSAQQEFIRLHEVQIEIIYRISTFSIPFIPNKKYLSVPKKIRFNDMLWGHKIVICLEFFQKRAIKSVEWWVLMKKKRIMNFSLGMGRCVVNRW